MKRRDLFKFILSCLFLSSFGFLIASEDGWVKMLADEDLTGWKSNEEIPNCFSVENGILKVSGGRAHLFYTGKEGNASFVNFEFKAKVKTTKGSNGGIYFHTEYQKRGWPSKGYEAQVNSSHKDNRKTASLYGIQDVHESPSVDDEWCDYYIRVEGKHIIIKINGKTQVDYTEPDNVERPNHFAGRLLMKGTFGIQGHDPKSTCYYKDLYVKKL
ncbi:MAG: DUF1080 domain-containing protein [Planctomycetes bacterium]|nr:DUF1080 domain-containing protein [Planctomycetota bacterium]